MIMAIALLAAASSFAGDLQYDQSAADKAVTLRNLEVQTRETCKTWGQNMGSKTWGQV
jgi:hypothetical protein